MSSSCSIETDDDGGSAEVTAHFGPGNDPGAAVAAAAQAAGLTAAPEHTTDVVPPEAWTQTIEDSYQPLCVVPSAPPHPSGVCRLLMQSAFLHSCCCMLRAAVP
jgi:hypothetical protein